MIFITLMFLSFLSSNYAQHSVGVKASRSIGFLSSKNVQEEVISPVIYYIVPNYEVNYIFEKDNKTSFLAGLGVGTSPYPSQFIEDFYPEIQYLDYHVCLKIPIQYRRNLKDWFYVGIGTNTRITLASKTTSNSSVSYLIKPAYESHRFQLEVVGTTGVQFDFWNFSYHLGIFGEAPIIHREYINLGLDTGLFFNF